MASITIIWHTMMDDRVCPICRVLEEHRWTFEVGKDSMDGVLTHPTYGVVWSDRLGSMAHGHGRGIWGECRCNLTYEADLKNMIVLAKELREQLQGITSNLMTREGGKGT